MESMRLEDNLCLVQIVKSVIAGGHFGRGLFQKLTFRLCFRAVEYLVYMKLRPSDIIRG